MKYTFYLIIILLAFSANKIFAQDDFEIITPEPYEVCENGSFTFEVDNDSSYNYIWKYKPDDKWVEIKDTDDIISGAETHKLDLLRCNIDWNNAWYMCERKPKNGPASPEQTDSVKLIVLSNPKGTSVIPESICPLSLPDTITLETKKVNDHGKVLWYLEKDGASIGEGTKIKYELASSEDSIFYVRWELPGGCYSTWDSVSLEIMELVETDLSYNNDTITSSDSSLSPQFFPSDIEGVKFWAEPGGLNIDEETGVITFEGSILGEYTIKFTIKEACSDTSDFVITVQQDISAAFHYDKDEYCKSIDEDPLPNITGDEGGKFSSDNPDIKINPNTGLIKLSKTKPGEYDITYTIVSISSTVNITIKDLPAAPDSISSSVKSYCYNSKPDKIRLLLHGGGDGNSTLIWYKDSINYEVFSGNTELIVTGDDIPDKTTQVLARWENDCGFSDTVSLTIHVSHNPDVKEIEVVDGYIFCKSDIYDKDITFNIKDNNPEDSIIVYQDSITGTPIINEITNSFTVKGETITNDNTIFYALWENECGRSDTTEVEIYLDEIWFETNLDKEIDSVCNLSSWVVEIEAENLMNTALKYKWYKNGVKLPGQNKAMLSLDVVTADDNGIYYCMVERRTKPICSIFSDSTELKVVELENRILTKGINEEYEIRDSVPVLLVGSNPGLSYQWYFKGGDDDDTIHGANQQYYYPSNYLFKDGKFAEGTYRLEASDTTNNLRCQVIDEYDIELPSTTKSSIVVYPNPNKGNSTINIPGNPSLEFHDEGMLRIWNLMGALEREVPLIRQAEPLSISIRNLSSGMYMVEVQFKNGDHYTDKIIVQ